MPRNNSNGSRFKAVCACCGDTIRLSYENKKGLHPLLDFFCSKSCLETTIQTVSFPAIDHVDVCLPLVPTENRTERWNGYLFASKYEVFVAQWLTSIGEVWWYEKFGFHVGDSRTWTPDFFLPERNIVLEVKGQWGCGQISKMNSFIKQYPEVGVVLVPWFLHDEFYIVCEE